ncbi:MAG: ABC transporter ATP-binding protein [Candidatus Hydrogenedentes bacterium]|nr:ABC transporter ATP-binding protein [Candidatus Hydrogenedentota bacterium]
MIQLEHVSKIYATKAGPVTALDDVTLRVDAGEFVTIKGPSGCGKSTLLLSAGAMLHPTKGTVIVKGQELYLLSEAARGRFRSREIGFVFQMFHLLPYLTVLENVLAAARHPRRTDAIALLQSFGLAHRAAHRPPQLSTGERQRTALVRALINRPALILADEPTGNLDPENAEEVQRHLVEFNAAGGTVLVVSHGADLDDAASRTILMRDGKIVD